MPRKKASGPQPRPQQGTGEWRHGKWTGKWEFSFTSRYPRPDGGRRQIHRRGFASWGAANDKLKELLAGDRPPEAEALTVADVLDDFLGEKELAGRAPNTIAQHRWAANRAKELWGGWPADGLTYRHINKQYLAWQKAGRKQYRGGPKKRNGKKRAGDAQGTEVTDKPLKNRSIEAFHRSVKAAFRLAVQRGHLPSNPFDLATAPSVKAADQERTWWEPEQVGDFIEYDETTDDLPTGMVDTLADTGNRRGEATALRWSDLDLDKGTATITRQFVIHPDTYEVEVRPTKRPRSKATIHLHPETVAKLKRRKAEQAAHRLAMGDAWPGPKDLSYDLVFTWADGRLIRPDTLTRIIARMSTKADGLSRITPHGLRHSHATAALTARVPVKVVADRLGNTVRVVEEIYAHVIRSDDQDAAQVVGDLYRRRNAAAAGPRMVPCDAETGDTDQHEAEAS